MGDSLEIKRDKKKGESLEEFVPSILVPTTSLAQSSPMHVSYTKSLLLRKIIMHGKITMQVLLSSRNKLGFVDGSLKHMTKVGDEYETMDTCNNLVVSWINNSNDLEISGTLISTTSFA